MPEKREISALKAWLLLLASLIDDAVIVALVFLGLWYFHVKITWPIILVTVLFIGAFIIIMYVAVIPALRLRIVTGAEGMLGAKGKVIETLDPKGTVEIKGEYWKAVIANGTIEKGWGVEVVGIKGLKLKVKEKKIE